MRNTHKSKPGRSFEYQEPVDSQVQVPRNITEKRRAGPPSAQGKLGVPYIPEHLFLLISNFC